jgi:hypothetical protein
MSVYVDNAAIPYRGKPRFHMTADALAELHEFARRIPVNRCWFHRASSHPHYDVTADQRDAAIAAGATSVDTRTLLAAAKRLVELGRTRDPPRG